MTKHVSYIAKQNISDEKAGVSQKDHVKFC